MFISEPFVWLHPSATDYLSVELATLKEITQELASLFGLTLPVSHKKEATVRI
jgi:hypothetical protein